jgi:hypothetical protein
MEKVSLNNWRKIGENKEVKEFNKKKNKLFL